MPASLLLSQVAGGQALGAGTVHFGSPGTGFLVTSTTGANRNINHRLGAGNFSKLAVFISANGTTATSTLGMRINAVNLISLSIPAGTTGKVEDASSTAAVSDGLTTSWHLTVGAGGSLTIRALSSTFTPTDTSKTATTLIAMGAAGVSISGATGTTSYNQVMGRLGGTGTFQTTEAPLRQRLYATGDFTRLSVRVSGNTRTSATTITLRKNGVNTALQISVAGGATGTLEDASATTVGISGDTDDVSLGFVTTTEAANTAITFQLASTTFVSTSHHVPIGGSHPVGVALATASALRYLPLTGDMDLAQTTETALTVAYAVPSAGTFDKFGIYVSANARTNATTYTFRKNNADTTLAISIAAGATGHLQDITNSVTVAVNDLVNGKLLLGTGNQSITFRHTVVRFTPPSSGNAQATIAQTLPALTQAATGRTEVAATAASVLPALTQSSTAKIRYGATAASTLPTLTQSASARGILRASAASTLPALTQAATARASAKATAASTLPALAQSVSTQLRHRATAASTLPALTQSAAAKLRYGATAASTLPALTQSVASRTEVAGQATTLLPALTQSATGRSRVAATAASILPALTQAATGRTRLVATAASTLPALSQAATGRTEVAATAASTLPALTQSATANVRFQATAASTLPALTQEATGRTELAVAIASLLPALVQSATAQIQSSGAIIASVLPALTQQASVTLRVPAQAASVLPWLAQGATGDIRIGGAVGQQLPELTQAVEVSVRVQGVAGSTLPALIMGATVQVRIPGQIASTLPALTQLVTVGEQAPGRDLILVIGVPRTVAFAVGAALVRLSIPEAEVRLAVQDPEVRWGEVATPELAPTLQVEGPSDSLWSVDDPEVDLSIAEPMMYG